MTTAGPDQGMGVVAVLTRVGEHGGDERGKGKGKEETAALLR